MPDTSFDVTRFVNRNGVTSWRVSGWLHGLRFRKNFKTREEADAERAALKARPPKPPPACAQRLPVCPMNSREKGKRGERRWCDVLREAGFLKAYSGVQYSGGTDLPDVACPELPASTSS